MKFKITVMSSIELVNTCLGLHHWLSSRSLVGVSSVVVLGALTTGQRSCAELARMLGMTAAGVTCIADRLVAHRLITRHKHDQDRRQVLLRITPEGVGAIEALLTTLPAQPKPLQFSKDDIRAMLIRHGLIQREAAENPEGYDNYETWDNVIRFTNELEKET